MTSNFPTISVLMATWNREKLIGQALKSIRNQNYPQNKIEIIIADAGSTDKTLEIARQYKVKVFPNPLVTAEAGKAVALCHAKGDLVAFIDSDNLLPNKNWFRKMVAPFNDPKIIGSEPLFFTYRRKDGFIDRYCALLGMNDPYCFFLGVYDRFSTLTGKWTGLKMITKNMGDYIELKLTKSKLPTLGANGAIFRKVFLKTYEIGKYLFDVDILSKVLDKRNSLYFAKVKIGIIHLFAGANIMVFLKKQERRIRDFRYYRKLLHRQYDWNNLNRFGVLKFILPTVLIFPLVFQSLIGYCKKRDVAWFFHPLACQITLWVYCVITVLSFFKDVRMDRSTLK